MILDLIRRVRNRLVGRIDQDRMVKLGLRVGRDVYLGPEALIDPIAPWLVTLEDGAIIAPRAIILAHDASMWAHTGYTQVAPVVIGARAFVGAGALVLPGVTIGADAVIGAGSVVTRDIPAGVVAVGNPARVIGNTEEFVARQRAEMAARPIFSDVDLSVPGGVPLERREAIRRSLADGHGYVP
jgi:maltose O-acetyltransferase